MAPAAASTRPRNVLSTEFLICLPMNVTRMTTKIKIIRKDKYGSMVVSALNSLCRYSTPAPISLNPINTPRTMANKKKSSIRKPLLYPRKAPTARATRMTMSILLKIREAS